MLIEHELNQDPYSLINGWYIPESICDSLISLYNRYPEIRGRAGTNRGYSYVNSLNLPSNCPELQRFERQISKLGILYREKHSLMQASVEPWYMDKFYNIQHYSKNQYYKLWHCENDGIMPRQELDQFAYGGHRSGVFMTYLNDVNSGGETEFYYQQLKIKPKKGLTLIWPAFYTHIHRGCPTEEEKYVATGWFIHRT